MCYSETYSCTITCINGDLNRTLLNQGVAVTDLGARACSIGCGEAVRDSSWATTSSTTLPIASMVSTDVVVWGALVALIVFTGLAILYLQRNQGNERKKS